jgi:hypothetical protein
MFSILMFLWFVSSGGTSSTVIAVVETTTPEVEAASAGSVDETAPEVTTRCPVCEYLLRTTSFLNKFLHCVELLTQMSSKSLENNFSLNSLLSYLQIKNRKKLFFKLCSQKFLSVNYDES